VAGAVELRPADLATDIDGWNDLLYPGKAVQVEPSKPMLKAPGTKRLKVKYDELLYNIAFKCKFATTQRAQQRGVSLRVRHHTGGVRPRGG